MNSVGFLEALWETAKRVVQQDINYKKYFYQRIFLFSVDRLKTFLSKI